MKPTMKVVQLQHKTQLLSGSPVVRTSNNVGLKETITGGNSTARSRTYDDWEDDSEDYWDE